MAKARTAPARWLRNPLWDLCLLAFCWVPFYLWVVFGLGLGRDTFGLPELDHRSQRAAMLTATLVALGTTYVHRHYTFFVVYGDGHTFRRHARGFLIAPLLIFAFVGAGRYIEGDVFGLRPWLLVLLTLFPFTTLFRSRKSVV